MKCRKINSYVNKIYRKRRKKKINIIIGTRNVLDYIIHAMMIDLILLPLRVWLKFMLYVFFFCVVIVMITLSTSFLSSKFIIFVWIYQYLIIIPNFMDVWIMNTLSKVIYYENKRVHIVTREIYSNKMRKYLKKKEIS